MGDRGAHPIEDRGGRPRCAPLRFTGRSVVYYTHGDQARVERACCSRLAAKEHIRALEDWNMLGCSRLAAPTQGLLSRNTSSAPRLADEARFQGVHRRRVSITGEGGVAIRGTRRGEDEPAPPGQVRERGGGCPYLVRLPRRYRPRDRKSPVWDTARVGMRVDRDCWFLGVTFSLPALTTEPTWRFQRPPAAAPQQHHLVGNTCARPTAARTSPRPHGSALTCQSRV